MPSLQIESGKHRGKRVRVPEEGVVVGRGEEAGLRIASGEISREHCRLQPDGVALVVTDLGSSNGTLVNGTPIAEPTECRPGDRITIGPVAFSVAGPAKARKKPPAPNVRKASKPDRATDDEIDQWLSEDVPEPAGAAEDTHILKRDDRPALPPPTRTFESVAEEAADIIRRHTEAKAAAP